MGSLAPSPRGEGSWGKPYQQTASNPGHTALKEKQRNQRFLPEKYITVVTSAP